MKDLEVAEYGNVRVARRQRPGADATDVVITIREGSRVQKVIFDGPDLVVVDMKEGVAIDWEEDSFISYTNVLEEEFIVPIFYALAKVLGLSTDADEAYHRGEIEGQNKVLWQWVKSERGPAPIVREVPKTPPWQWGVSTTPTTASVSDVIKDITAS